MQIVVWLAGVGAAAVVALLSVSWRRTGRPPGGGGDSHRLDPQRSVSDVAHLNEKNGHF